MNRKRNTTTKHTVAPTIVALEDANDDSIRTNSKDTEKDDPHHPVPAPTNPTSSPIEITESLSHFPFRTRNFFELSIQNTHVVQVLFFLRIRDLEWWNHPENVESHERQLYDVLTQHILPTEFPTECQAPWDAFESEEDGTMKMNRSRSSSSTSAVNMSNGTRTGKKMMQSHTHAKKRKLNSNSKNIPWNSSKANHVNQQNNAWSTSTTARSTGATVTDASTSTGADVDADTTTRSDGHTKMDKTSVPSKDTDTNKKKGQLDFHILPSETIVVTYKVEPSYGQVQQQQHSIHDTQSSCTLLYDMDDEQNEETIATNRDGSSTNTTTTSRKKKSDAKTAPLVKFRKLIPMQKRIILWCYPRIHDSIPYYDDDNYSNSEDGGFFRPDMIPLAYLFAG